MAKEKIQGNKDDGDGIVKWRGMTLKEFCEENNAEHLLVEFDYEKNRKDFGIGIGDITYGTDKKVYWVCPEGHGRYEATVKSRTLRDTGCRYCARGGIGRPRKVNRQSLRDWCIEHDRQDIIEEFDIEKNKADRITLDNIGHGSRQEIWWKCKKCGHGYQKRVYSRTLQDAGCSECGHTSLIDYCKSNGMEYLLQEFDIERNKERKIDLEKISYASHTEVCWICPKGHKYEMILGNRTCGRQGCSKCSQGTGTSVPEQILFLLIKQKFPEAKNRFKGIGGAEIDIYIPELQLGIEYDGVYWHSGKEEKDKEKAEILRRHGVRLLRIAEHTDGSLEDVIEGDIIWYRYRANIKDAPIIDLLNEWFKRNKYSVIIGGISNEVISEATVNANTVKREESLAFLYPDIAKEWDYNRNKGLTPEMVKPHSNRKAWFKCSKCGQSWGAAIDWRASGNGCPICSGQKVITGINDLQHKFPELVRELWSDRNSIKPDKVHWGSNKKVIWHCKLCGHEWIGSISNQVRYRTKCKNCGHQVLDRQCDYKRALKLEEMQNTRRKIEQAWIFGREIHEKNKTFGLLASKLLRVLYRLDIETYRKLLNSKEMGIRGGGRIFSHNKADCGYRARTVVGSCTAKSPEDISFVIGTSRNYVDYLKKIVKLAGFPGDCIKIKFDASDLEEAEKETKEAQGVANEKDGSCKAWQFNRIEQA